MRHPTSRKVRQHHQRRVQFNHRAQSNHQSVLSQDVTVTTDTTVTGHQQQSVEPEATTLQGSVRRSPSG
jgi:hypothetical protein